MDLNGAPMLGTPKQNSFIIKLAGAIGYATLLEAVNFALGLHASTPWRNPFTMGDASQVITNLLEKCKLAGISTFGHGGGRKKGGKRKPTPTPAPAPPSTPPLPGTPRPDGPLIREFSSEDLEQELRRRGKFVGSVCEALQKASAGTLAKELAARAASNPEELSPLPTPLLCGELERRGLPAGFLISCPDAVAQARPALEMLLEAYLDDEGKVDKDAARVLLINAGEENLGC